MCYLYHYKEHGTQSPNKLFLVAIRTVHYNSVVFHFSCFFLYTFALNNHKTCNVLIRVMHEYHTTVLWPYGKDGSGSVLNNIL